MQGRGVSANQHQRLKMVQFGRACGLPATPLLRLLPLRLLLRLLRLHAHGVGRLLLLRSLLVGRGLLLWLWRLLL